MNVAPRVPRLLIVEDDPDIREMIRMHMAEAQYSVVAVGDGLQALAAARQETVDLVILDLALPGRDGIEVCRALSSFVPRPLILMLTARSTEFDRVRGLNVGADDYLVKPFSVLELVARVRALLRRPPLAAQPMQAGMDTQPERIVTAGSLEIDLWERCARLAGRRIELTSKEFELLLWFVRNPQRIYSRAELLDAVWGHGYQGFEHTVNSHLNRLRGKLEQDPSRPAVLITVRGGGYKLIPPTQPT